jgi:hypothetical protein
MWVNSLYFLYVLFGSICTAEFAMMAIGRFQTLKNSRFFFWKPLKAALCSLLENQSTLLVEFHFCVWHSLEKETNKKACYSFWGIFSSRNKRPLLRIRRAAGIYILMEWAISFQCCYFMLLSLWSVVLLFCPVKKTKLTTGGICCADHATPSIRKSWH